MQYLTTANGEMTTLLTQKAESEEGVLPDCQAEQLKVLEAIKYDFEFFTRAIIR